MHSLGGTVFDFTHGILMAMFDFAAKFFEYNHLLFPSKNLDLWMLLQHVQHQIQYPDFSLEASLLLLSSSKENVAMLRKNKFKQFQDLKVCHSISFIISSPIVIKQFKIVITIYCHHHLTHVKQERLT